MDVDDAHAVEIRKHELLDRLTLHGLFGSRRVGILPLGFLSLGLWILMVDPVFVTGHHSTFGLGVRSSTISLLSLIHLFFFLSLNSLRISFAQILHMFRSS